MKHKLAHQTFALLLLTFTFAFGGTTTTDVSTWVNCINLVPSVNVAECQDSVVKGKVYKLIRETDNTQSYTPSSFERRSSPIDEEKSRPKEEDSFLSSIGGTILMLILAALGLGIYFLPVIVAANRSHNSGAGIFVLNLFLGWTLIGWVIALIWSVTGGQDANTEVPALKKSTPQLPNAQATTTAAEIEQLSILHKSGHISEEEFVAAKKKLLGL